MTLHLQIQTTPGGPYSNVDFDAKQIASLKTHISYSHPAMLEMEIHAPQQSFPLGIRNFLRLWDDADSSQSALNPHFEGFIEQVTPGQTTQSVKITAYDPTRKVSSDITIMSLPWLGA